MGGTQPESSADAAPASLLARARNLIFHPSMRQRVLAPMGFDASILIMNLITGIAVARALGPAGRGELAAILLITQMAGWIFSLGSTEAVSYRLARHSGDGPALLGSWLALAAPLTLIAVALGELVLPVFFAAQTPEAIELGRIYLPVAGLLIAQCVLNGILLGDHDFLTYNLSRFIAPALIATGYIALWISDELSVERALAINAIAFGAACLLAAVRSLRRHGIAAPSRALLKTTLSYGMRAYAGSMSSLVNGRLDLLIIPAFLGAASVGLYSVATNVSSVIGTLTGTIAILVLPLAARRDEKSARTVVRTMHAVLAIGLAIAIPLEFLAEACLSFVYGSEFGASATALRTLLPGAVVEAAAMVLWSGLLAANRPFLSSVAAAPAAIVTTVGLLLFLEQGGIEVAAIVTTVAYTVVFVISLILYRRVAGLRWRDYIHPPAR